MRLRFVLGGNRAGQRRDAAVALGAFAEAIRAKRVRCLVNHDAAREVARMDTGTLRLEETAHGLFATVQLPAGSEK